VGPVSIIVEIYEQVHAQDGHSAPGVDGTLAKVCSQDVGDRRQHRDRFVDVQ
jgi:hypothetical protein